MVAAGQAQVIVYRALTAARLTKVRTETPFCQCALADKIIDYGDLCSRPIMIVPC